MVDAMNGPQDRENSAPADPGMQAEKHHRHLEEDERTHKRLKPRRHSPATRVPCMPERYGSAGFHCSSPKNNIPATKMAPTTETESKGRCRPATAETGTSL